MNSNIRKVDVMRDINIDIQKKSFHSLAGSKNEEKLYEINKVPRYMLLKDRSKTKHETKLDNNINKNTQKLVKIHKNHKSKHSQLIMSQDTQNTKKLDKLVGLIHYVLSSTQKLYKYINNVNFQSQFAIKLYESDRDTLLSQLVNLQEISIKQKLTTQFIQNQQSHLFFNTIDKENTSFLQRKSLKKQLYQLQNAYEILREQKVKYQYDLLKIKSQHILYDQQLSKIKNMQMLNLIKNPSNNFGKSNSDQKIQQLKCHVNNILDQNKKLISLLKSVLPNTNTQLIIQVASKITKFKMIHFNTPEINRIKRQELQNIIKTLQNQYDQKIQQIKNQSKQQEQIIQLIKQRAPQILKDNIPNIVLQNVEALELLELLFSLTTQKKYLTSRNDTQRIQQEYEQTIELLKQQNLHKDKTIQQLKIQIKQKRQQQLKISKSQSIKIQQLQEEYLKNKQNQEILAKRLSIYLSQIQQQNKILSNQKEQFIKIQQKYNQLQQRMIHYQNQQQIQKIEQNIKQKQSFPQNKEEDIQQVKNLFVFSSLEQIKCTNHETQIVELKNKIVLINNEVDTLIQDNRQKQQYINNQNSKIKQLQFWKSNISSKKHIQCQYSFNDKDTPLNSSQQYDQIQQLYQQSRIQTNRQKLQTIITTKYEIHKQQMKVELQIVQNQYKILLQDYDKLKQQCNHQNMKKKQLLQKFNQNQSIIQQKQIILNNLIIQNNILIKQKQCLNSSFFQLQNTSIIEIEKMSRKIKQLQNQKQQLNDTFNRQFQQHRIIQEKYQQQSIKHQKQIRSLMQIINTLKYEKQIIINENQIQKQRKRQQIINKQELMKQITNLSQNKQYISLSEFKSQVNFSSKSLINQSFNQIPVLNFEYVLSTQQNKQTQSPITSIQNRLESPFINFNEVKTNQSIEQSVEQNEIEQSIVLNKQNQRNDHTLLNCSPQLSKQYMGNTIKQDLELIQQQSSILENSITPKKSLIR